MSTRYRPGDVINALRDPEPPGTGWLLVHRDHPQRYIGRDSYGWWTSRGAVAMPWSRFRADGDYLIESAPEEEAMDTAEPARCAAAANLQGRHVSCDGPADHKGWAHSNREVGLLWEGWEGSKAQQNKRAVLAEILEAMSEGGNAS